MSSARLPPFLFLCQGNLEGLILSLGLRRLTTRTHLACPRNVCPACAFFIRFCFSLSFRAAQDAGLLGVSCIAADNHLDNFMWYTLHNLVSHRFEIPVVGYLALVPPPGKGALMLLRCR